MMVYMQVYIHSCLCLCLCKHHNDVEVGGGFFLSLSLSEKSAQMKEKGILLHPLFLLAEKELLYPHELSQHLRLPEATIYSPSS